MINIEEKINSQDQASSLRTLMGKFSGQPKRRQVKHLSRINKLINALRDERVINAQIKRSNSYLLGQISERDLMLDDCYETITRTEQILADLEIQISSLKSENEKLRSFKGIKVVA